MRTNVQMLSQLEYPALVEGDGCVEEGAGTCHIGIQGRLMVAATGFVVGDVESCLQPSVSFDLNNLSIGKMSSRSNIIIPLKSIYLMFLILIHGLEINSSHFLMQTVCETLLVQVCTWSVNKCLISLISKSLR